MIHITLLPMRRHLQAAMVMIFGICFINPVQADNWDLSENSLMIGVADVDWTVSPTYQGTKLLLGGRYVFEREPATAYGQPDAEVLKYRVDLAEFQVGDSATDLEYLVLGFTYWTYQKKKDLMSAKRFNTVRDQLELLQINGGFDDNLGVDYYYELNAGRIGRFWSYRHSDGSPITITLGLNASLGWAWASSVNPSYTDVSNPTMGLWNALILGHDGWGQLYITSRVVSGYTFGEPKSTTSREANARFGIRKDFSNNLALDFFGEKRSFHFAAFDIPDLYTKAKRIALELTYKF